MPIFHVSGDLKISPSNWYLIFYGAVGAEKTKMPCGQMDKALRRGGISFLFDKGPALADRPRTYRLPLAHLNQLVTGRLLVLRRQRIFLHDRHVRSVFLIVLKPDHVSRFDNRFAFTGGQ